ncbi:enoyl-CoA hydratase-related protein [Pigmentiphaga soli]|uniref:Enoyl-CoA hydratase-related protein n=1 Tax=Pigmentiphaga soli TaxID=1007095 RepID=A0ABP8H678_9BURK
MKTEFQTLRVERPSDAVLLVTLNRPERYNAIDTQTARDLIELFEEFSVDAHGLRCIVLTGAGDKAFCAGGDLKERKGMTEAQWRAQHALFERAARALVNCPLPLIGAVNGLAYGGGCELAALCDFLYAASTARFALTEVTLGIMPGMGGTQTLPRTLGERRAQELIQTGRPFTAQQAERWGLVNEILEPAGLLPHALDTARCIAANAPIAVRQAKQAIRRGLQMSLSDAMAFEIEAYNRLVPTRDRIEGVLAFNEKRKPIYRGE